MADIARQLDSYARQSQQTEAKLQGLKNEEQGLRQALAAAKAEKAGAQQAVDASTLQLKALEQEVKQQQLAVTKLQESNDTIRASIKAARNQQQSLTQTRCSEQEAFLVAAKQLDQEVDALLAAATSLKPPPAGTTGVAADGALTPQVGSPGAAGGPAESDMVLLADVTAAGGVMSGVGHGSSSSGLLLGETEVQLLPGMEGSPQSQQQQVMLGGLAAGSPPAAGSLADHHLMAAEAVGAEGGMGESQGTGLGSQHLAATGDSQGQDMAGEVGASQKMLQLAGAVEAEEDDVCRGSDQSASQVTV